MKKPFESTGERTFISEGRGFLKFELDWFPAFFIGKNKSISKYQKIQNKKFC